MDSWVVERDGRRVGETARERAKPFQPLAASHGAATAKLQRYGALRATVADCTSDWERGGVGRGGAIPGTRKPV